jgi:hypothetical protein
MILLNIASVYGASFYAEVSSTPSGAFAVRYFISDSARAKLSPDTDRLLRGPGHNFFTLEEAAQEALGTVLTIYSEVTA